MLCYSSQIPCLCGSAPCLLCRCCPSRNNSTVTRLIYAFFLLLGVGVSCIMLMPGMEGHLKKVWHTQVISTQHVLISCVLGNSEWLTLSFWMVNCLRLSHQSQTKKHLEKYITENRNDFQGSLTIFLFLRKNFRLHATLWFKKKNLQHQLFVFCAALCCRSLVFVKEGWVHLFLVSRVTSTVTCWSATKLCTAFALAWPCSSSSSLCSWSKSRAARTPELRCTTGGWKEWRNLS